MYPRSMFLAKIRKKSHSFHLKITFFTIVKYCSILHGHVCVMEKNNLHDGLSGFFLIFEIIIFALLFLRVS